MNPNNADGMVNSVDCDQTATLGATLLWVCTVCPGISVRKLRIITVTMFLSCKLSYHCAIAYKVQIVVTVDLIFYACLGHSALIGSIKEPPHNIANKMACAQ